MTPRHPKLHGRIERVADAILNLAGPVNRSDRAEARELYRSASATYIDVLDTDVQSRRVATKLAARLDEARWQLDAAGALAAGMAEPAPPRSRRARAWLAVAGLALPAAAIAALFAAALATPDGPTSPTRPPAPVVAPVPTAAPPVAVAAAAPVSGPREIRPVVERTAATEVPAAAVWARTPVDRGMMPAVAPAADGRILIADRGNGTRVTVCPDFACRYQDEVVIDPLSGFLAPEVVVDRRSFPVLAYAAHAFEQSPEYVLNVAHCLDPFCERPARIATVATTADDETAPDLAVGADGGVAVVYPAPDRSQVWFVACEPLDCGAARPTVLAEGGLYGYFPAVAVGPDALPLAAYWDVSTQELSIVRCTDPSCTATDSRAIVDLGDRYAHLELHLAFVDGLPLVAYGAGDEIGLLRCTDRLCRRPHTLTTIATGDSPPLWMSVAVGPGGEVAVGYLDRNDGEPWLVRCGDPACTTFSRELLPGPDPAGPPSVAYHDGELLLALSGLNGEPTELARPAP